MEQNLGVVGFIWLIPLLPFVAAGLSALLGRQERKSSASLAIGAMTFSFLLSVCMLAHVLGHQETEPYRKVLIFNWFVSGTTPMQLGFVLDSLSALMLIVVSLVSLLVFIFSIGTMDEDSNSTRFFTFLSLFGGSMLGLVISNSLLMLFIFWELVGFSSYILIAFWYQKPSAAAAGRKAFLVTRIGDIGFFIGLLLLFYLTKTSIFYNANATGALQPAGLKQIVGMGSWSLSMAGTEWTVPIVLVLSLLIFCGAIGKSGQFPLHVWLPDAMEGPTPVSALIHAATMVAAGVFLVARMFPLFELSPVALDVVAYVGAFTALLAAIIGCAQFDIKRILAYSTISQLGYMMMGLGLGGYVAGMFHLFTHAFFKALLFLGAGSIIHACRHEQDIRNLGGLLKKMPVTSVTYLIGAAALCGVFPFAGFWSKDEILIGALQGGSGLYFYNIPFLFGAAAAVLTAFYMTRQCIYVFFGDTRNKELKPHESAWVITVPLLILAFGSALAGFVGFPGREGSFIHHFLAQERPANSFNVLFAVLSQILVLIGAGAAALVYWKSRSRLAGLEPMEKLSGAFGFGDFYRAIQQKFYFDEIYDRTIVAFNEKLAQFAAHLDRIFIDGLIFLLTLLVSILSALSHLLDEAGFNKGFDKTCGGLREAASTNRTFIQTGILQNYLKILAVGVVVLFLILMMI